MLRTNPLAEDGETVRPRRSVGFALLATEPPPHIPTPPPADVGLDAFNPFSGVVSQIDYSPENGTFTVNAATDALAYVGLLDRGQLAAAGAPDPVLYQDGGQDWQPAPAINPAFTAWLSDNRNTVSGQLSGNVIAASVTGPAGQPLAQGAQNVADDGGFMALAMLAASFVLGPAFVAASQAAAEADARARDAGEKPTSR